MVKPKPISDSAVRITLINVRSALMRVRWNDMPVRRDESSTDILSGSVPPVTAGDAENNVSPVVIAPPCGSGEAAQSQEDNSCAGHSLWQQPRLFADQHCRRIDERLVLGDSF